MDSRSSLCTLIFRLRNPSVWFTFLEILLTWIPQLRSSDIVIPRYLAAVAFSSFVLWRKCSDGMEVFDLVGCRTWHFAGLKFISQDFFHCSSLERSSCRMFASDNELISSYMAVLSGKSLTLVRTCSGRSLMHARKRMGPRTEPCGTPEDTGMLSELIPLITTDCFLLSNKVSF